MTTDAIGVRVIDQARHDLAAFPLPACGERVGVRGTRIRCARGAPHPTSLVAAPSRPLPASGARAPQASARLAGRQGDAPCVNDVPLEGGGVTRVPTPLVRPRAALFVAFFVAPLIVLVALSLTADTAMTAWTAANYLKFFTDRFNYSILWDTLFLGVKATLVCLVFGY